MIYATIGSSPAVRRGRFQGATLASKRAFQKGAAFVAADGIPVDLFRRRLVKRGLVMRTPSVVTHDAERDTYLVLDDFGGNLVALGARSTSKALIARR